MMSFGRLNRNLGGLMAALILTGWCAAPQAAPAKLIDEDPPIRVLLADSMTSAAIMPTSSWRVASPDGSVLAELAADVETTIVASGSGMVLERGDGKPGKKLGAGPVVVESADTTGVLGVKRIPYGVGWWWEAHENRIYEGQVEFRAAGDGKLVIVGILPLERYLRGVVPSEIGADSPHEALCAQAVAARAAAVLALTDRIYAGTHHDICADVACQAYSGLTKATPASDAAVAATRGLVLMFDGKPLSAYYASNCGGFTEDIRNVWPDRADDRGYWNTARYDGNGTTPLDLSTEKGIRAWIDSSPDVFCNPDKSKVPEWSKRNFRWTREFTADEMTSAVATKRDIGRVTAIRAVKRGPSGRLIEAEFVGEKGVLKVSPELAIRQVVAPPLRSAAFIVETRGGDAKPDAFVIRGAGWGHGVGMCQTGAVGMANMGRKHPEILKHYFSNASLEKLY